MPNQLRRRSFTLGAGLAAAGIVWKPETALAQGKPDIVIGASIPLSGIFAATAYSYHNALQDYVKIVNEQGGVDGRKLRYHAEDTAYKVDLSVAAFNKITARETVNFYYGDSTPFAKTIAPEVVKKGNMLMSGTSFGTELNDPAKFPLYFMPGPDYSEMVDMLLRHIAQSSPKSKVALIHADNEFGRDPLAAARESAKKLGLELVLMATPPGSVDVSAEILKLRRINPDYTIFHGYTLAPIPEFITQAKGLKLKTRFMGTIWTMDLTNLEKMGASADGFLGVSPYRYYFEKDGTAPMLERIRTLRPEYQQNGYMQGFLTAMLFAESARRTLSAGKAMTGSNLKAALNSIKDFDTGGIVGVPITITGNSVPYGRIYRYQAGSNSVVPASDWIKVGR
ncbi:MAG: ABC transporter substrate-binding protein [Ottowia sp.]|uniref:ABC transporter substrate-binding protein n=1 Tax=Ottowia sp. TaxID=1898956 RepID=UPI003C7474C2